jgi:lipoprotein signal peptidase
MGLSKLVTLMVLGLFVTLNGVTNYGIALGLEEGADNELMVKVPAIIMMILGFVTLSVALFMWLAWFRNRLIAYNSV